MNAIKKHIAKSDTAPKNLGAGRGIMFIALMLMTLLFFMPPPDPLFNTPYSTVLTSREGKLLSARIAADEQWHFPATDTLPEKYKIALLNYEDKYFYDHPGINPVSLVRAFYLNAKAGKVISGGSTITMQLARMIRGNQPRTLWNKVVEMFLALRMELYLDKEEILNEYSAHAPFGGNVVGLEAASWRYYGRSSYELSWAETANLAVLPNAPGLIFPGSNEDALLRKRNKLLKTIFQHGYLDEMDFNLSLNEDIPGKPKPLPDHAPHLTQRSIVKYGSGNRIKTTLNHDMQIKVNALVDRYYEKIKHQKVFNAAVLVTHIKSGETISYVGNTRKNGSEDHGSDVDVITSPRSPGSLLKPILYGLALDEGLITPNQLLPDVPLYYQGFVPQNFDKQYRGAVPASNALQSSLNIPFVNLLKDYGYEKLHSKLKQLGVHSIKEDPGHYGLTMILGGSEVTLWEMNNLYAGMARSLHRFNGSKGKIRYLTTDYESSTYIPKAKVYNEKPDSDFSIMTAGSIWLTLKAMEELKRPGMRSNWKNYASAKAISWKTGTSYGHKDAWSVGLNSEYVVGVWVGNADGEGRPDLVGTQMAAPLMFDVFELLSFHHAGHNDKANSGQRGYSAPIADLKEDIICIKSGFRAGPDCMETERSFLPKSVQETKVCPFHRSIYLDKSRNWQVNSSCYPIKDMIKQSWFILPASQSWYYRKSNQSYKEPPGYMSDCNSTNEDLMEMVYPKRWAKVYIPTEIDGSPGKVIFEAAHQDPETPIYWHLDNEYVGLTRRNHQMGLHPTLGEHTLSLLDKNGHEVQVNFEVLN